MSILVDDSNKTACRAAEAGLQQKNCAALVRPAGTGKGCIVWELLDAHPGMRVLWVVSCAARLELRRALTKRLGRTLGGRVRLMSCEQLAVQNALGWVALAEFRPGLLILDGWREMSAKDWTDCVQPLFRLCPGAKLLALGEPDAPGDSCRAAEEMLADAIVEPLALGGAMAEGLLPMPASYTALLGLRPCGGGRRVRPLARGTLPRIRLADADRRQPDKRPVGLPERLRRRRPPGA